MAGPSSISSWPTSISEAAARNVGKGERAVSALQRLLPPIPEEPLTDVGQFADTHDRQLHGTPLCAPTLKCSSSQESADATLNQQAGNLSVRLLALRSILQAQPIVGTLAKQKVSVNSWRTLADKRPPPSHAGSSL